MRTYSPVFHSATWYGPVPMFGAAFGSAPMSRFSQMCLGRIGMYEVRICWFGWDVVRTSVCGSGAVTAVTSA